VKIAPQAWRFVIAGVAADAAACVLIAFGVSQGRLGTLACGVLLSFLATLFVAFCLYFYRDPERALPQDLSKIYSPGDGRVLSVGREGPGDTVTLRIFLSVFDVHLQRAPCSGRVAKVHYQEGTFRAAMVKESYQNERSVMTIEPEGHVGPLIVEQIAGLIARRIETWPKPGQTVKAGERYGIIYFGSQAAVHFPASARCTVKIGDRVAGGITPIGEWVS
jgi:phosphatidylserine decarboxylase